MAGPPRDASAVTPVPMLRQAFGALMSGATHEISRIGRTRVRLARRARTQVRWRDQHFPAGTGERTPGAERWLEGHLDPFFGRYFESQRPDDVLIIKAVQRQVLHLVEHKSHDDVAAAAGLNWRQQIGRDARSVSIDLDAQ